MSVLEKRANEFDKLGGYHGYQSVKQSHEKMKAQLKKLRE